MIWVYVCEFHKEHSFDYSMYCDCHYVLLEKFSKKEIKDVNES